MERNCKKDNYYDENRNYWKWKKCKQISSAIFTAEKR